MLRLNILNSLSMLFCVFCYIPGTKRSDHQCLLPKAPFYRFRGIIMFFFFFLLFQSIYCSLCWLCEFFHGNNLALLLFIYFLILFFFQLKFIVNLGTANKWKLCLLTVIVFSEKWKRNHQMAKLSVLWNCALVVLYCIAVFWQC